MNKNLLNALKYFGVVATPIGLGFGARYYEKKLESNKKKRLLGGIGADVQLSDEEKKMAYLKVKYDVDSTPPSSWPK